ncbi:MAG: hypothetical protein AVDCRST_MAG26-1604, partial [uncultured Chloroflexia bacterium]
MTIQNLVVERFRSRQVSPIGYHPSQGFLKQRKAPVVGNTPGQGDSLFQEGCRLRQISADAGHVPKTKQRIGSPGRVPERSADAQSFLGKRSGPGEIVEEEREFAGRAHGVGAHGHVGMFIPRQCSLEPLAPFDQVATSEPEMAHGRGQAQRGLGTGLVERPVQRGPDVVEVDLQQIKPTPLVRSVKPRRRFFRPRDKPPGVSGASNRAFSGRHQRAESEIANALQHRVADAAIILLGSQQICLNQRGDALADIGRRRVTVPTPAALRLDDRRGGFRREAAGKDAERAEQCPPRRRLEVVAPVDGIVEALLPGREIPVSPCEKGEAIGQPGEQLSWRKRPRLGCGKLNRQRQTIQPATDASHGPGVLPRQRKRRVDSPGAPKEQLDRFKTLDDMWCAEP